MDVIELQEKCIAAKWDDSESNHEIEFNHSVRLDDVTFQYNNKRGNAIKKVSITIPKNLTVALVGPSGGGSQPWQIW